MEAQANDIVLEIKIGDANVLDANDLLEALDGIEQALYASDRRDIQGAAAETDIPAVVRDASLERLRSYRHHRMRLLQARSGSLVLIGAVAGVAYFVLEKTLGEAFADGFKQSDSYARLREFFRRTVDEKTLFIGESLRRTFRSKHREVDVVVLPRTDDIPNRIAVHVHVPRDRRQLAAPSLAEQIDKER